MVDAAGTPWIPHVLAVATTRAGATHWCTTLTEATAQAAPPEVTVGGEATGPYGLRRYDALMAQGYRVLVLHPCDVKARRGTTLRGTNTDPVDARLLPERWPRQHGPMSHGPEATGPGRRELPRWRADRVAQLGAGTRRLSRIRARPWPACATDVSAGCGQAARPVGETWTWPEELAAVPPSRRAALLARVSHGHVGSENARAVQEAAPQRIGVRRAAAALALERRLWLRQSRDLEPVVAALERESQQRDPGLAPSLRPRPGGGQTTAPAMWAEIGDSRRFTDAEPRVALGGGDPPRHESGQTAGHAQRRQRGSPSRRRAVWHAALTACRRDPLWPTIDDRQRQRGQPHLVARSQVAHKLTRVRDAVLQGQRPSAPPYPLKAATDCTAFP